MKFIRSTLALLTMALAGSCPAHAQDPLPAWNDGAAKQSILTFVAKVTKDGSPDFVPSSERIATFDNDGTLWCEQPLYFQFLFALDRVKVMALKASGVEGTKEPFALALLKGDRQRPQRLRRWGARQSRSLWLPTPA